MKYPRTVHANVLLLDGKIINWKIGDANWVDSKWVRNRQPDIAYCVGFYERVEAQVFAAIVNNVNENQLFFNKIAIEFFKMFEISEYYEDSMFLPYNNTVKITSGL